MEQILAGMQFLSFENLQTKDKPPRKLWLDTKGLRRWFEKVQREDPLPSGDYVENEAAQDLISYGG
jgi:hypothetical protein